MTVIDKIYNGLHPVCGSANCATIGPYISRKSNGGDRLSSEPAGTPHYYDAEHIRRLDAAYKWWSISNPDFWGYSAVNYPSIISDAWTTNDDLKLLNKLRERVDDMPLDMGTAGAELGKSVDMLANRLKQAALAARQAKRGQVREALSTLRADPTDLARKGRLFKADKQGLAQLNLEVQYGFRTLAGDVYDLATTIADTTRRGRRVYASRRKLHQVIPGHGCPLDESIAYIRKSIVAYLEVDEPTLPARMGLTNPYGILWEVTPWSLVVDWALPIGDWIAAQSFEWRTKGTFVRTEKEYFRAAGSRVDLPSPGFAYEQPGRWFRESANLRRIVEHTLNTPLPTLKSPLKSGEPLQRLANAFSLLVAAGTKSHWRDVR